MTNIRFFLCAALCAPSCMGVATAQAPGHAIGRVLDALTREPVIAASVFTEGHSARTDTSGFFRLSVPPLRLPMEWQIKAVGYNAWSGTLQDLSQEHIVLLEPSEYALGAVVVSATMKEARKDASPIPIEVYTARFFQKNATPNIFEALSIVNGVRPQLNCNVCNTGDIRINGMPGPYTMVTIDGMPIVSGLSTVYGLAGIPNGLVDRIEVVKGPAGALYGSEAVGGMINIITKHPATAPRVYADVFATGAGEYNADAGAKASFGKAQTLVGVNYFNFQRRIDINKDNFTDMALQNRLSVFNKWNFERKHNRVAAIAARYVSENRWGGELQWAPRWRGTDSVYGESVYTRRAEALGKYQAPFKKRRVLLDVSWNLHDQDAFYGTTAYKARQQVSFGQITTDLPLGKSHDALVGAAVRYTLYDDNTPATARADGVGNMPSKVWLPGAFVQDEISVSARNRMLLGLRYDYNSAHGHILTPRVSWKWAEDAQHALRVTTGSGYRVASIFTEDHAALTGAREVLIVEDLRPERSWNANVNYVRKFFPENAGFIGLDASLFYTYFINQIIPDYNTDPNQIIYKNLSGHAISSGASLNMDFNFLNGVKTTVGVTALRAYRQEQGQRLPQLFAPLFSGVWAFAYPIQRWGLTIDYTGNFNSPMYLPVLPADYRPERSPWFSIHNIQLSWGSPAAETSHTAKGARNPLKEIVFYVGVKNLLGFRPKEDVIMRAFDPFDKQTHIDNPNNYTFDPTYNYAPMQGRRLLVGLRWHLDEL